MDNTSYIEFPTGFVLVGDCLDRLRDIDDCSIDSIVTDPPYGIEFMGKEWDSFKNKDRDTGAANPGQTKTWCDDASSGIGVGGPRFSTQTRKDMLNFQAWFTEVAVELLRVLKPGGHLLSFGGTRAYHRMVCAVEDAGFEIRDSIHWTYGSGFPKSHNVAIAIDKAAGKLENRGVRMSNTGQRTQGEDIPAAKSMPQHQGLTEEAQQWQGWGTALKPSHEPIVVARKPLVGTVASNVLAHGTGALNIDGCRVGQPDGFGGGAKASSGFVDGYKGDGFVASTSGRWPANTILTHAADCQQTGTREDQMTGGFGNGGIGMASTGDSQGEGKGAEWQGKAVSVPVWACVEHCPVYQLDQQSGIRAAGHWTKTKTTGFGEFGGGTSEYHGPGEKSDKGGASRFFTQTTWDPEWDHLLYVAKPSKAERNAGLDGLPEKSAKERYPSLATLNEDNQQRLPASNSHPTVKPVALMAHLIRMVTPPGGTVLDPFLGSGTTAVAAIREGFTWVGCEMTPDYLPIIEGRVEHAQNPPKKKAKAKASNTAPEQLELPA